MHIRISGAAAAGLAGFLSLAAGAQTPPAAPATPAAPPAAASINVDPAAGYEDSLICYQFHGVNMQIAKAMKGRAGIADNQKAQYESVEKRSTYLQQKWFKHLGDVNGDKGVQDMNADLQRVAGGVIADANAGLGGDAEALKRGDAVRDKCGTFEKVEVAAAPG